MPLVRITKREGEIQRVTDGETPPVDLILEDNEYVTNVELRKRDLLFSDRKTVDWYWTAYVVTPL